MSCGGDVPFNAGPATAAETRVYGSARAGAIRQRCFDLTAPKVTAAEVDAWADHMIGLGCGRVVGLLTRSELDTYEPGALERLGERFAGEGRWINVEGAKDGEAAALRQVLAAIDAAVVANERVVVHCWGGGGRTGNALAGWLAARGGVAGGDDGAAGSAEAAVAAVSAFSSEKGLKRRADAAGAQLYVDAAASAAGGGGGKE